MVAWGIDPCRLRNRSVQQLSYLYCKWVCHYSRSHWIACRFIPYPYSHPKQVDVLLQLPIRHLALINCQVYDTGAGSPLLGANPSPKPNHICLYSDHEVPIAIGPEPRTNSVQASILYSPWLLLGSCIIPKRSRWAVTACNCKPPPSPHYGG